MAKNQFLKWEIVEIAKSINANFAKNLDLFHEFFAWTL